MRELFDLRLKARSLAYLFIAGAALGLLTLAFPHDESIRDGALYALAAIAITIGALYWWLAPRVREWHIHAALLAATAILAFANYYTGTSALYPILFSWPALYAFYFFRLPAALVYVALIGLAYGIVLAIQSPDSAVVRWLLAVGTPAVAGLLISRVLGLLRLEAGREQELLREQAARVEAERVAEMVSGMQLLVDAALAHRNLDDILTDLVPRVQGVLGADAATVFLAREGALEIAASTGGVPDPRPAIDSGEGFPGRVVAARGALLEHDPPQAELVDPALGQLDVGSAIGVPLLAEGEVTGVIVVCAARPRRFSDEDLGLLGLAADRVALAIEHARVYEREHRIAETLQRSLLPERLPQVPGLAVAARYLPAAEEAEVGGDWYDVIPLPGGGAGLVMGDVAGKGLAAASMVGRLRSALRAYAVEGHDPAVVVQQLNRLVWTELEESQMATLLYVRVDPTEGEIRWVNAGHLPPLIVVGDRLAHFLEGERCVPLGVLPFPTFVESSVKLDPGGAVLLYTDGLVERPGEAIDSSLERLAELVREGPSEPAALCDQLLSELVPAGGADDDVALLALQSIPIQDRFSVEFPAEPEALSAVRALLRRWLRHAEGTDQEIAEVTTACGEAATNAIEHAGSGGGVPFAISGSIDGREIDIIVSDRGSWRDPRGDDRGRGISLMQALMDEVEVTPGPDGTTVRLRRTLNGDGPE